MTQIQQIASQQVVEQVVEAVQEAKKSTGTLGINQIGNVTPNWATWMFRIYFYVAQFAAIFLAFFTRISAETKVEILAWIAMLSIAVHGFSKMWGINTKKIQQEAIEAFSQTQTS